MDPRAALAREHHRLAGESDDAGARHRQQRDDLIRVLRGDGWKYDEIARAVGCSYELVAQVVTRPKTRRVRS